MKFLLEHTLLHSAVGRASIITKGSCTLRTHIRYSALGEPRHWGSCIEHIRATQLLGEPRSLGELHSSDTFALLHSAIGRPQSQGPLSTLFLYSAVGQASVTGSCTPGTLHSRYSALLGEYLDH
jgi:hypothetical protein